MEDVKIIENENYSRYENYSRDELVTEIKTLMSQLEIGEQKFYQLLNTNQVLNDQIEFLRKVILNLTK